MSEKEYCPICKKNHEVVYLPNVRGTIYKCSNGKHYGISETVLYADNDVEKFMSKLLAVFTNEYGAVLR